MAVLLKYLLPILPFVLVFISTLYTPQDPDLGWHLKYGEYFFQHGQILRDNTFSTTMADFKWANSSWGTDLITYLIFNSFGFLGLTIAGAVVITLTFYFFSKVAQLTVWDQALLFPLLLFFENPVNSSSFRGQLLSILFLGILFYLGLMYQKQKSKKIFLVVPLFLLWINFHGQSVLGLLLFITWIMIYLVVTYLANNRRFGVLVREAKTLGLVLILTVAATLINPFGMELYKTAVTHFSNPQLQYIAEYLPFDDLSVPWWNQVVVGILLMFGFIFLYFTDQIKERIPLLGITSLLYGMSFLVRRYAWSMYYLTLPLLKPLSEFFKPESWKPQQISAAIILVTGIMVVTITKDFNGLRSFGWDNYCQQYISCSAKAVQYLIDNKLTDNLLTFYDWGGFIVWNYPQIKPSIDGRMHLWKDEKGYSAFEEYYPLEQNFKDIDQSKYDIVLMSPKKPMYARLLELVRQKKWKLEYKDDLAGVFVRN